MCWFARLMAAMALVDQARANVIGIDFGSDAMKVAVVQPGTPLEIVTNYFSKRKTETVVAFVRGERQFGSDAYGMLSRKPELSYARLPALLGRHEASHPAVERVAKRSFLPMRIRFNETRHALALGATATTDYTWEEWTVEELVAMILAYAKEITKAYGGNVVRDCVIAMPCFASQAEREAMLQAASLADLRVLSLVDDNTAAAVQFGLDRVFDDKRRVLIYNLGSESAQASVVEYSSFIEKQGRENKTVGQLEVLGKGWSLEAGSFALDLALTELLASDFEKQTTTKSIRENPRPMAKIRAAAKKAKEILSANTEHRVVIPSLHNDIDYQTTVTRQQLEEAAKEVFEAVPIPVKIALAAANLTADDIDAVEIIGGGVRVPKVQETLKQYLASARSSDKPALELSVHLNGDEAIALGAAFHGANVSTSFRVRKVGMIDHTPYAIGVKLTSSPEHDDHWHKRASLYKAGAKLGGKPRTIAFQHDADVVCVLAYDEPKPLGQPDTIAVYDVSGIADFAKEMAKLNNSGTLPRPKVQLSFSLDSSGIADLSKAEVSVVEEFNITANLSATNETILVNNSTQDEEVVDTNATRANETTVVTKKKTHKRALSVTKIKIGIRDAAVVARDGKEAAERLATIQSAEALRIQRAEAKNALETLIYATRNALEDREDEIKHVSTEEQRDEIRKECTIREDWLYDEADAAEIVTIDDHRRQLAGMWAAVTIRLDEAKKRPDAIAAARRALELARKNATEIWPKTKPWLDDADLDDLLARVNKASTWLDDMEAQQAAKLPHEDPVFLAADIVPKLKPVATAAAKLALKPKPSPTNAANATDSANATNAAKDPDATDASNATEPNAGQNPDGDSASSTPGDDPAKDEL